MKLCQDLNIPTRFRDIGLTEKDLRKVAFETSEDAVQLAPNPTPLSEYQILGLLREFY